MEIVNELDSSLGLSGGCVDKIWMVLQRKFTGGL